MSQDPNQPSDPAEGGYASEGYDPNGFEAGQDDMGASALDQSAPSVASPQNRMLVMLLGVVAIIGVVVVMLMGGSNDGPSEEELAAKKSTVSVAPPVQIPEPLPTPPAPVEPTSPEPDRANLPPLPLPPMEMIPPPPMIDTQPVENPVETEARRKAEEELRQRRLRSGMVMSGGGRSILSPSPTPIPSPSPDRSTDPNVQFEQSSAREKVVTVQAEAMTDGRISVSQGKIIAAVIENAINTDFQAPIRAIVSRDVYAEAGRNVMIPKGSRVIGKYNNSIIRGQRRVYIIWSRIMRPDGTSISINAPGLDQIGRGGIEGTVDNKFLEIYSAAILTSMLTIGAAVAADQVIDGDVSTTNSAVGGSNTTGSAGATAVQQSITDMGSTTRRVVEGVISSRPTVTVDQGTRVNIFVNQDMVFPSALGTSGVVLN